jgi:Transposase DDE domain
MLSSMSASVAAELDGFCATLAGSAVRQRGVSAQAFSQARRGFSASLFDCLNQHLIAHVSAHIDLFRWRDLRLVAADASRLRVSTRRNADLTPDHFAFALFLPGSEITLHASLHQANGCERQMLIEALDHLNKDDLLLLDRGYPSATMAAILEQRQMPFCMRVEKSANGWKAVRNFMRSGAKDAIITLPPPSKKDAETYEIQRLATRVRLVRNVTPSGRIGVLMTNLCDAEAYPAAEFSALYHQRWRIEEAFKRLKHRLRLEAPTGLTYLAFQQDFGAKILADNLCTLLADLGRPSSVDTNDSGHSSTTDTPSESAQGAPDRANRTYAIGALKGVIVSCLLRLHGAAESLRKALKAIAAARCRIKPNRRYPRRKRDKTHAYLGYKVA